VGLTGIAIEVEVDVAGRGFPTFTIVGLPNKAIDEAKERVRTAVVHAGFEMPDSRITVNMAPADIPKTGSGFDLPIAVGILAASGIVAQEGLRDALFIGEVSLEGRIRRVNGSVSLAMLAREKHMKSLYIPTDNAYEAAFVDGVTVYPVATLSELVLHLNNHALIPPQPITDISQMRHNEDHMKGDFADVKGQAQAKRALEIAAAGFHNIHLRGSPGAGKTLLSRVFVTILPDLTKEEVLEVSRVYSAAGMLGSAHVMTRAPFRSPHHTTSKMGLIGGGTNPTPGEITLAHRGVLFLDELTEFPRSVLEALRQPLEDGVVTVARAAGSVAFPARFLLLGASNPCPCGYLGHPQRRCTCHMSHILKYKKKLSGPLTDRIDLHIDVSPVENDVLTSRGESETSKTIAERVQSARTRQRERLSMRGKLTNGEMSSADIRAVCSITSGAEMLLKKAVSALSLSARSYFKTIKVSQTISDLENADTVDTAHVAEALQYRSKES
jgi:magnesium chelatase family protein